MRYLYKCPACAHKFDVDKHHSVIDQLEHCPMCAADCDSDARQMCAPALDKRSMSAWNDQAYNPGLGCVTYGKKDAERKAKAMGLIEVGNEKLETVHKHFDKQREDTKAARWAEADREMVYGDNKI